MSRALMVANAIAEARLRAMAPMASLGVDLTKLDTTAVYHAPARETRETGVTYDGFLCATVEWGWTLEQIEISDVLALDVRYWGAGFEMLPEGVKKALTRKEPWE